MITNNASMAALQTLRSIGGSMNQTQQQVSTGLRVAKASDNAAYWSIATSMRSDKGAMEAVSDSMAMGKAVLDVTYNGMSQIRDELTTIRNLVITASSLPPPATNGYPVSMMPNCLRSTSPVTELGCSAFTPGI